MTIFRFVNDFELLLVKAVSRPDWMRSSEDSIAKERYEPLIESTLERSTPMLDYSSCFLHHLD